MFLDLLGSNLTDFYGLNTSSNLLYLYKSLKTFKCRFFQNELNLQKGLENKSKM